MVKKDKEDQDKKTINDVKTFTVPSPLKEIKENISTENHSFSILSKEQILYRAFKFHSEKNISEALKYYQYFIKRGFNDHRVFANYALILKGLGKLKESEIFIRKSINLNSNLYNSQFLLASILIELKKLPEAEQPLLRTIELKPDFAEAHLNLGTILKDLEKLEEAEIATRKAIELKPDFAQAYSNLGTILNDLKRSNEAELSARKAIKLQPDFANANYNLGKILIDLGKFKEAELYSRKAIELKPDFAEAHYNLGNTLKDLGKYKEAELSQSQAIKLKPNFADAHFNLSLIELVQGNYQSGLENYEFRFNKKEPAKIHAKPLIRKIESTDLPKAEKLLIITEQGLGDTLHYMRYIPYLRNKGFDLSFCAQSKLHSLIKSSLIDDQPLKPEEAHLVKEGVWIALLSLPKFLGVRANMPIISNPYIRAKKNLNEKWKKILSKEKLPIIGINWQGNKKVEETYQGRSIPLEIFGILLKNNKIKFLSLQKGYGSEQLSDCSFRKHFVHCQDQIDNTWDFEETAAIMECCDLIISNDSCVATMAGGMGKPIWLLLRAIPYWTWGLEGDKTFWYPSMRLFRQKELHNWKEVFERVSIELEKTKKPNQK